MSTIALTPGQTALATYQDIKRVVDKRYMSRYVTTVDTNAISMALQRLGEAVVYHYELPADSLGQKRWRLQLQHSDRGTIDLSTTEKMLSLKVVQWESAMAPMQAGHDVWTRGREEGFRPQPSLQETLELNYSEVKRIVDTTAEQAQSIFEQLQRAIEPEKHRLSLKGGLSQTKSTEIFQAERRLEAAIAYKYVIQPKAESYALSADEKRQLDNVDLYTTRTMFDVKVNRWSLKDACNLSTNSLASQLFGLQVSMWGKTGTLENVERAI